MPAISAALFARFASRQSDSPTMKAVAALRAKFGGHSVHAVAEGAARPSDA
jgi:6-phosphogluconate dehydrogenase